MSWFKSLLAPALAIAGNVILPGVGGAIGSAIGGAIASSDKDKQASQAQAATLNAQTQATDGQLKLAQEQWDRYEQMYGPLEQQTIDDAKSYGSEANRTKAAEEAAGAVTSSYANLREQLASTPGLDPSSQKYLDTASRIGLDEAAQSAAAQTGARRSVDSAATAMKQNALSLGKNLPLEAGANLRGAAGSAAALGVSGQRSANQGAETAYGVGRMFGDVASNPSVIKTVGGLFGGGSAGDSLNNDFSTSAPMDDFMKYGTSGD